MVAPALPPRSVASELVSCGHMVPGRPRPKPLGVEATRRGKAQGRHRSPDKSLDQVAMDNRPQGLPSEGRARRTNKGRKRGETVHRRSKKRRHGKVAPLRSGKSYGCSARAPTRPTKDGPSRPIT